MKLIHLSFFAAALMLSNSLSTQAADTAPNSPTATATQKASTPQNSLAWTEWELVAPSHLTTGKMRPTLSFRAAEFGAYAGGNRMGGRYSQQGIALKMADIFSTRMMPPEDIAKIEHAYAEALKNATSFRRSADGKMLRINGQTPMTFRLQRITPGGFVTTTTKMVNLAPFYGACLNADGGQCLQLEDISNNGWGKFTAPRIAGFAFEEGSRYTLSIEVQDNPRTHARRLVLKEILAQEFTGKIKPGPNQRVLSIAPNYARGSENTSRKMLTVREGIEGGDWKTHPDNIAGFRYAPDYLYHLLVDTIPMRNRAGQITGTRYKLVKVLLKQPVTR